MPQKIIRSAYYGRVSDEKQEKMYSPSFQKSKCLTFMRENNFAHKPEHEFFDTYTGRDWRHRKDLQKLLDAAKQHEFDVVVMYRLDRFSRDLTGQIVVRDQLKYYGVRTITLDPDEHADDDSALGTVIQAVYGFQAEITRKKIVEITQDGLRERVAAGRLLVGRKPKYGYQWQDIVVTDEQGNEKIIPKALYVIDDLQTSVVQLIHKLCDEGWGLRRIAIYLTNNAFPTPNGGSIWRPQTVRDILRDEYYIGRAAMYKRKYEFIPGEGIKRTMRPKEEWVYLPEGVVPAIVEPDVFARNQQQLRYNFEHSPRNNPTPEDSLCIQGIAKCGYCGSNMSVFRHRKRGWVSYVCYKAKNGYKECPGAIVRNHILDGIVREKAIEIILDPKQVEQALAAKKTDDPHLDTVKSLTATLHDTIGRIQNLMETLETTPHTEENKEARALMSMRLTTLSNHKAKVTEELDRVKREQLNWTEAQKAMLEFKAWCDSVRPHLCDQSYQPTWKEMRNAIEQIGIKVYVYREEHDPRFIIDVMPPAIREALGDIVSVSGSTF